MKFSEAIGNQEARTLNNMKARKSTANACVDLFYKIGASRGKDIIPDFVSALVEDEDVAVRIAQWARDVRGGAGERQLFRNIISYLANNRQDVARRLLHKIPELGRWDDVLEYIGTPLQSEALDFIANGLDDGNGLLAKWLPRQKFPADVIRKHLGLTPKQYRKLLVRLTNVVETKMCNREWNSINFAHVPSLAHARYRKAFIRNSSTYQKYLESLKKGETKISAGAVYPYDVIKGITRYSDRAEKDVAIAQWNALPNYLGDQKILAMVDTSGSMSCPAGGYQSKSGVTCRDVAISLGMYVADKLTGDFKDCFLSFSNQPQLVKLKGDIVQKLEQFTPIIQDTNLHAAFELVLQTATKNNVPQDDMPDTILIMSDMQFNQCIKFDDSAYEMIQRKYESAGYEVPKVVFWNLNAYGNAPVKFNQRGVALVSGFSPSILTAILGGEDFSPEGIMRQAIMKERYDF